MHVAQSYTVFWVFVSAPKRAIGNVVLSALTSRRRPIEDFIANLASVFGFIAALPFVCTQNRTEAFFGGRVKHNTAHQAWHVFASLALWSSGTAVTFKRAMFLVFPHTCGDYFPAPLASNCTNCTFIHNCILAQ